jgi:hypothetical protein
MSSDNTRTHAYTALMRMAVSELIITPASLMAPAPNRYSYNCLLLLSDSLRGAMKTSRIRWSTVFDRIMQPSAHGTPPTDGSRLR